jgi:cell division septum initiation protein DivIVA
MSGRPLPGVNDELVRPPLRYRRFGGGYRREDVDLLFAELRLTLRALELELGTLRDRTRDLEDRLRDARSEIDTFHAKGYELARAMSAARERTEKIEQETQARAEQLIAEAEAEAARRIEAAEAQIAALAGERNRVLDEIRDLVNRVGASIAGIEGSDPVPGIEPEPLSVEDGFPGADLSGLRERFATHVELDAGPFPDFDSVAGFERELAGLAEVEDVYVRRVSGERATIELTVAKDTLLLAEMQERLPYHLEVRDRSLDRLVIDVEAAPAAAE